MRLRLSRVGGFRSDEIAALDPVPPGPRVGRPFVGDDLEPGCDLELAIHREPLVAGDVVAGDSAFGGQIEEALEVRRGFSRSSHDCAPRQVAREVPKLQPESLRRQADEDRKVAVLCCVRLDCGVKGQDLDELGRVVVQPDHVLVEFRAGTGVVLRRGAEGPVLSVVERRRMVPVTRRRVNEGAERAFESFDPFTPL